MFPYEKTFDNTAEGYDRSRPEYPEELFRDIFCYKQVNETSNVLEIGVGTGKATQPILDTHCSFTGIEPGSNMAGLAKQKLKPYNDFSLFVQTFQEYVNVPAAFDLIYSATAFHWIEEEYGYKRVFELLKSGGAFARFSYHATPDKKRPQLTQAIQRYYDSCMTQKGTPKDFDQKDASALANLASKYGFVNTAYKMYHLEKDFTADEYMELLYTYPNHMALKTNEREKLFHGIHSAIRQNGGIITVNYIVDLELATKP